MTTAERAAMTVAQYEAACQRIRDAGQLARGKLHGISMEPGTDNDGRVGYCAVGALLNGPDGFGVEDLEWFDRIAKTEATASEDLSYGEALPDKALARLREVYGIEPADVDNIITANDASEPEGRTLAVIATLGSILRSYVPFDHAAE